MKLVSGRIRRGPRRPCSPHARGGGPQSWSPVWR